MTAITVGAKQDHLACLFPYFVDVIARFSFSERSLSEACPSCPSKSKSLFLSLIICFVSNLHKRTASNCLLRFYTKSGVCCHVFLDDGPSADQQRQAYFFCSLISWEVKISSFCTFTIEKICRNIGLALLFILAVNIPDVL